MTWSHLATKSSSLSSFLHQTISMKILVSFYKPWSWSLLLFLRTFFMTRMVFLWFGWPWPFLFFGFRSRWWPWAWPLSWASVFWPWPPWTPSFGWRPRITTSTHVYVSRWRWWWKSERRSKSWNNMQFNKRKNILKFNFT